MALSYDELIAYIDGLYADGSLNAEDYGKIIMYILGKGNTESNPRDLIQIRRGNQADLPTLAQGEPAITLDTEQLYIGGMNGNIQIPSWTGLTPNMINVSHPPLGLYPVVGDGIADDSNAFQAIVSYCIANNIGLYIPLGVNVYLTRNISAQLILNINIEGEISGPSSITVSFGGDARSQSPVVFNINKINGPVLQLAGIKNGLTNINYASNLQLFADRDDPVKSSIAYSRFILGFVNVMSFVGVNRGWINENVFIGGRIHTFIMDGDYSHNNNTFYKPFLESSSASITFNTGSFNQFMNCRLEAYPTINFSGASNDNLISYSWYSSRGDLMRDTVSFPYTDNNGSNIVSPLGSSYINWENVYSITPSSYNYPYGSGQALTPSSTTIHTQFFNTLFSSDFARINKDVGFVTYSDAPSIRVIIKLYTADKTQITSASDPGLATTGAWSWVNNAYQSGSIQSSGICIYGRTSAKFMTVEITTTVEADFSYFYLYMKYYKQTVTHITAPPLYSELRGSIPPSTGTWKYNATMKNASPAPGSPTGWVCTASGSPGTWVALPSFPVTT